MSLGMPFVTCLYKNDWYIKGALYIIACEHWEEMVKKSDNILIWVIAKYFSFICIQHYIPVFIEPAPLDV